MLALIFLILIHAVVPVAVLDCGKRLLQYVTLIANIGVFVLSTLMLLGVSKITGALYGFKVLIPFSGGQTFIMLGVNG